jgi:hypothetical protein
MTTAINKQFDDLAINGNNGYVLPETILTIIQSMCEKIGYSDETQNTYVNQYNASTTTTTTYTKPAPKEYDGRANFIKQNARKNGSENGWKTKPTFNVTKFALVDNTQVLINEIRSDMNKISEKNVDAKLETLRNHIDEIVDSTNDDEDDLAEKMNKLFDIVFSTSVANKLPIVYAKVFKTIHEKQPKLITEFIVEKLARQMDSMNNIVDVSETNYDEFCEYTAKNLSRKNTSALFCEIAKCDCIPQITVQSMTNMLTELLDQVCIKIEDKTKQKEVEEITENIVVIFAGLGKLVDKSQYLSKMQTISGYKSGEKPGLTSRTKFKYMDLIGS